MDKPFEKSIRLHDIRNKAQALQQFHLYRYGHFVKSSSKGEDCTYAVATKKHLDGEVDDVYVYLRDLRDLVEEVMSELA